ncbi:diacylglycerol kinase [Desulfoprunum benzoelyticum]|uniref:Diacylglycerol kinase n=1 Tax=Desulfoprunum benzoelyticum TaxID=1506996 RepID=A0A840UWS8_9BACT|nr:diacylglycerol kinase [Desulfoprunum benzoelyticum]MBB5347148.1 diacylglycerol kinase (ATP) [Desulfoprunum benzoelyticum]MBM9531219.1 diacylglycerol kinase [Desulfoprunum benzoelyticum]
MKANKTGIARILAAFTYSADGISAAFRHEAAFRQESLLYVLLLPLLYFLPLPLLFKGLLLAVNTLVLIVELLNSAIESVVDLVSPEYNIYAKRAKDMGSAAVLFSLLLALVLWVLAFVDIFFPY